jgi:hypothetical protein
MNKRPETNGQERAAPPANPDLVARLYEEIARLHASVQALRRTSEELEADRQRLLAENRALRRRITVSTLIDDLDASAGLSVADDGPDVAAPPPAEQLYRGLPARFSFPHYFQAAADNQLETATARRCLAHYLAEGMLVQSGAYLEKATRSGPATDD